MSPNPSRMERLAALERGDAAALGQPAELVQRAQALLASDDASGAEGLPEPLLELVALHAAERGRAAFLASAAAGPKALAKLVKKELYRLKSEGRAVELPKAAPEPASKPGAPEETLPAFMSPVDIDGRRTFIAPHHDARDGFSAVLGELSDVEGIVRVQAAPMPRRDYRKFARELARPRGGEPPWMELTASELGGFLAAALALNEKQGKGVEPSRAIVRNFPGEPTPAASRSWPPLEPQEERGKVQHGSRLFAELENARWMPANTALATLTHRIDEVATSRVVVDEAQRRQQIEAALDRTVEEYFVGEERGLWAERLFRQADYFAATGRQDLAHLAAANARAFAGSESAIQIPFARALFQKALIEQMESAMSRLPPEAREKMMRERQAAAAQKPADEPAAPPAPSGLIIPGR